MPAVCCLLLLARELEENRQQKESGEVVHRQIVTVRLYLKVKYKIVMTDIVNASVMVLNLVLQKVC